MGLWWELWNGQGKGDVGPYTRWQLSASGFVYGKGTKPLGAQAQVMLQETEKGHPTLGHPFSSLCCDHLVGAAQCLELLR